MPDQLLVGVIVDSSLLCGGYCQLLMGDGSRCRYAGLGSGAISSLIILEKI
jgi:hypothetical protein